MKKNKLFIAVFFATAFMGSCSKQAHVESDTPNSPQADIGTVYGWMSCDLEGGKTGCESVVVVDDDDCDMPTGCDESNGTYPIYDAVLKSMFSEEEIQERAINGVRITEPELLEALRLDTE